MPLQWLLVTERVGQLWLQGKSAMLGTCDHSISIPDMKLTIFFVDKFLQILKVNKKAFQYDTYRPLAPTVHASIATLYSKVQCTMGDGHMDPPTSRWIMGDGHMDPPPGEQTRLKTLPSHNLDCGRCQELEIVDAAD